MHVTACSLYDKSGGDIDTDQDDDSAEEDEEVCVGVDYVDGKILFIEYDEKRK